MNNGKFVYIPNGDKTKDLYEIETVEDCLAAAEVYHQADDTLALKNIIYILLILLYILPFFLNGKIW